MWHRAAQLKKTFEKDKKYELPVSVDYTAKGPQVTIMCDGACFSYLEHDLPKKLYVGVTGCEGLNRFYDFHLRTK